MTSWRTWLYRHDSSNWQGCIGDRCSRDTESFLYPRHKTFATFRSQIKLLSSDDFQFSCGRNVHSMRLSLVTMIRCDKSLCQRRSIYEITVLFLPSVLPKFQSDIDQSVLIF